MRAPKQKCLLLYRGAKNSNAKKSRNGTRGTEEQRNGGRQKFSGMEAGGTPLKASWLSSVPPVLRFSAVFCNRESIGRDVERNRGKALGNEIFPLCE